MERENVDDFRPQTHPRAADEFEAGPSLECILPVVQLFIDHGERVDGQTAYKDLVSTLDNPARSVGSAFESPRSDGSALSSTRSFLSAILSFGPLIRAQVPGTRSP